MPENFSSLLEALNAEGRELARPVPVGAIEARGRGRRWRRRFTAATSAVVVCAVAAGVALGVGGGKDNSAPAHPAPTPAPASVPASSSAPHRVVPSKNRVGTGALLLPDEAPQPALFQWKTTDTRTVSPPYFPYPICDFTQSGGPGPKTRAQTEDHATYTSFYDTATASEMIYHYASAAAAQQDYDLLKPAAVTCQGSHVVATIADGFAWEYASGGADLHRMVVLSGSDVAYWFFQADGSAPYDTSDDQAALQRMADRLDGGTPAPDPVTAPPPNTLPGSSWLDISQIPFGTADLSHGWYQMEPQAFSPGAAPSTQLCADADGAVLNGPDATIAARPYHGTPTNTPVYQGSGYLYSSADQDIATFPSADRAKSAFEYARQATAQHGCTFKDGSGDQDVRTIKVGATAAEGFSLLITDKPGPSYEHVYYVLKGTHVATLMVSFEKGDTSTGGDAAVLALMAAHLP